MDGLIGVSHKCTNCSEHDCFYESLFSFFFINIYFVLR